MVLTKPMVAVRIRRRRTMPARSRWILLAALSLAVLAPRADAAGKETTVTLLVGKATVFRDGAKTPVAQGQALREADVIETEQNARMELLLPSGTVLRLGAMSRFQLEHDGRQGGSVRARLALGHLWARVRKLLAGQSFEVETQNGVAGVRGTEFLVAAVPNRQIIRVYEGKVEVKGREGLTWVHLLEPGRELRYTPRDVIGPQPFDAKTEGRFMRWVRKRDREQAGAGHEKRERNDKQHHERHHEPKP
jgi:ferric-dicitrate binding protein FerR (iron transport regulator)